MDAETRKTLESSAAQLEREATTLLRHAYETNDYETRRARQEGAANAREDAAAIRSALAEIDSLNEALGCEQSRVTNLVSRITGKPGDMSNESVGEASREAIRLRAENLDLRARAKSAAEAFGSIDKCLAFSSRDHGLYRGDAWIYGIVCGWEHGDSKAMDEMAARHGWDAESVARLRKLHDAAAALAALEPSDA